MLYGKKLFEYHKAVEQLSEIENKLKKVEQQKIQRDNERKMLIDEIEDLESKELNDEMKINIMLLKQKLFLLEKDMEKEEQKWMEESFSLLQKRSDLEKIIGEAKTYVPEEYWKEYNKRKEYLENPIVEVKYQMCTGCFMNLTKEKIDRWRGGKEIVICDVCNRILA